MPKSDLLPIEIPLIDKNGLFLRNEVANHLSQNLNKTGAERGSSQQQGFGLLAEMVVRQYFQLPLINPPEHPVAYDFILPSGIKVDVKCRGGERPFQLEYVGADGLPREAKHNLFARQVYDDSLDTDIYLMTHLMTPAKATLPGTARQQKWKLYICGWVSKQRVKNEGVYLPRHSLTEQGNTWFAYRGQEIEYYQRNLHPLQSLNDLSKITLQELKSDQNSTGSLNMTSVDLVRIVQDLIGIGILPPATLSWVKSKVSVDKPVKPFLHPNQYFHALSWLKFQGQIDGSIIKKASKVLQCEEFSGI
ncbi:MAG: hypothetical protein V1487_02555 [bacterium]